MLDRSIREIERERQGLQAQEKKLITEIKKTAKEGQMVRTLLSFGSWKSYFDSVSVILACLIFAIVGSHFF